MLIQISWSLQPPNATECVIVFRTKIYTLADRAHAVLVERQLATAQTDAATAAAVGSSVATFAADVILLAVVVAVTMVPGQSKAHRWRRCTPDPRECFVHRAASGRLNNQTYENAAGAVADSDGDGDGDSVNIVDAASFACSFVCWQ